MAAFRSVEIEKSPRKPVWMNIAARLESAMHMFIMIFRLGVPKRLGNFGCSILKNGNHHDIRSIKKASWNTMVSNVSRKLKKTFLQNNLQSWLINLIAGQFWRTHPGFSRTPVIINAGHVLLGLQRCGHLFFGEWEIWAYHASQPIPH